MAVNLCHAQSTRSPFLSSPTTVQHPHPPTYPSTRGRDERRGLETGKYRPPMVCFVAKLIVRTIKLTLNSIQEALRMYFQPIKNDDPQLDFYTMYKRDTMEFDTEYMNKYNEDLNTTLIFVSICISFTNRSVEHILRLACSPRSAPPSSSPSSQSSSRIPAKRRRPTSELFSSHSIHPFCRTRNPLPPLPGAPHLKR